jgi:hypothetical protein
MYPRSCFMYRVAHGEIFDFKTGVLTKNQNKLIGQDVKTKKIIEKHFFTGEFCEDF